MTILGKSIFIFIILIMYSLSFILSRNASTRAIEKFFIVFFGLSLISSIIFSKEVWILLPKILGVYKATDSILYLFIIISISCNLILLRKIIEINSRLNKLVQKISLDKINHE